MLSTNSKMDQVLGDKRKLLFIDDDSSVIASLHLLFDSNYETFSASTVEEGLRIFEQIHPKIVILDLKLPDKSGIEALREIRKIDSSVAVVILTGYSTRLAAEESLRLGAVDYLNKPFDSGDLKSRIGKLALTSYVRESDKLFEHSIKESFNNFCDFRDFQNASAAFLHDVSGPLSCLMAGSDILGQKVKNNDKITTDEISSIVEMMSNSVSYLRALVDQWRSFSELHTLMHGKFEAQKAIDLALSQVMDQVSSSGIALQIQTQHGKLYIPGNHFAIARVLINLIKNALEAVSPTDGRVHLTASTKDNNFQFEISDNGPGISPKQINQLFTSGFTTKSDGKGLGLFISKKIIEAVGGTIVVCSPGVMSGADFIITLPLLS
jgi:signal transduction histidine kinase